MYTLKGFSAIALTITVGIEKKRQKTTTTKKQQQVTLLVALTHDTFTQLDIPT